MTLPDTTKSIPQTLPARVLMGRRLTVIAGLFILLVAAFMATNWLLLTTVDPLDLPALQTLASRLEQAPDDAELRQQLRELDLLARRAFFIRQWQWETGWLLLLAGGLVLILGLQLACYGPAATPDPRRCPGLDDPWRAATLARRALAVCGALAIVGALVIAWHYGRPTRALDVAELTAPARPTEQATGAAAMDAPDFAPAPADWPAEAFRNWPGFRGVGGLGLAPDADPPLDWNGSTGAGIIWQTPLQRPGYNSPIVWSNRVFLTGADQENREVYCFDADTGALLWTADTEGVDDDSDLPEVTEDTGYAAPSAATDGQRVAAIFGTGAVLGLDFDGRRLWSRKLPTPDNHYGHSSSLLLYQGLVFIQYDHFGGAEVIALDAETGQTRWEQVRAAEISWASPILARTDARMVLVLSAAPMVAAYDALTGAELWSNECLSGEIGSSPAYAAGRLFAANQYAQAVALDLLTGDELWTTSRLEMPDAGSPVATDRRLFLPTSYGSFSCIDAATGQLIWEHEFDRGGYGSPILAADRLYWTTEDGVTRIFRAGDEFELLAEPELGEECFTTPAPVGRRLYIRGAEHLFCIGAE
ncbi:MAG: PQQ-binding-like beta-propeller repeat protein [Kiritimatiellia bacterium]|nr:PQQ-like beta-propeller repeat protein [Lentisphaerota bacterium]